MKKRGGHGFTCPSRLLILSKEGWRGRYSMTLYTISEAAPQLRLSRAKLYDLVARRQIGHCRIDGKILFTDEDLAAFLASRRVEPVTPRKTPIPRPMFKQLSLDG
jgi:excisionase family DNA binding protein